MKTIVNKLLAGIVILFCMAFIAFCAFVRCDFESGCHKITPTSIDNDFWGNYKVYFKTSDYTQNLQEDFYYVDKSNKELADQIRDCIKNNQTIMVYYDKQMGFYGCDAPQSSPIVRIEIIE